MRPERTAAVAAEIRAAGGEAVTHDGDVAEDAYIRALVATTVDTYGRVDVLHNNAAFSIAGRVGDITDDEWRTSSASSSTASSTASAPSSRT
ncbi:SDR family NAD(P)-dependent oxidoreductase [Yinghuangia aomiensis]